jgi:hypothetical protein
MAEIKITQLDAKQQSDKVIDLKAESEKGSSVSFKAFTNLRGGVGACYKWPANFA